MTSKPDGRTVGEIFTWLNSRLKTTSDLPDLDARVLIAHSLDRPSSWVWSHPEAILTTDQQIGLEQRVSRMVKGEPLPYILECQEFYCLEFDLTPDVLIPRPETELLVERAIGWLQASGQPGLKVIDVGTGSGCIAISLAVNVPGLSILATDISASALAVARKNARKFKGSRDISFMETDLFPGSANSDRYSLIVSNPPYIPTATLHELPVFGREPTLALDGGPDGLQVIRRILLEAPGRLSAGGCLMLEIEATQGPAVLSLATDAFPDARIQLYKDLAGHDRLLEIQT